MSQNITVSETIENCRITKSVRLDLGQCGLTVIPQQVWEMEWLEELILGNNPTEGSNYDLFKVYPKVFDTIFLHQKSSHERTADLNITPPNNKFTNNNFGDNLFHSESLSGIDNLKNLRYLNLNRCGLQSLDFITNLGIIDILLIGGNTFFPLNSIKLLQKIKVRILDIFGLAHILSSDITENLDSIFDMKEIKVLNFSYNNNSNYTLPFSSLDDLTNLVSLDISYSSSRPLRFFDFQKLPKLKFLRAENAGLELTQIAQLPKGLTYLNISSNDFGDSARVKLSLIHLTELWIENNKIVNLSYEGFPALKKLYLSRNRLKSLAGIDVLRSLQELNIENNQVTHLTPVLDLPTLKILKASGNLIENVPSLKILKTLEVLSLSRNILSDSKQIRNLLSDLPQLKTLNLWNNPLKEIPAEKLGDNDNYNCLDALMNHFKQVDKGSVENNEIKLILIGNSTAGKTTLRKVLQGKMYNKTEDSTHGIVKETWELHQRDIKDFSDLKTLKVHIWDFGGQEYYHETHKLFFSENAVYIVVWENDTNVYKVIPTEVYETVENVQQLVTKYIEHQPYDYWLKNIRHYAPHCNVLVVQNKIDKYLEKKSKDPTPPQEDRFEKIRINRLTNSELDAFNVLEAFDLSLKKYSEKIADYIFDYEKFQRQLIKLLTRTVHKFQLGQSYHDLKNKIQAIRYKKVLDYHDDYRELCNSVGLISDNEILQVSKYLTDTSVILFYPEHETLNQKVFINPVWVSDMIYHILDNEVLDRSGVFSRVHVEKKMNDPELANDFIELMKSFQLIFPIKDTIKRIFNIETTAVMEQVKELETLFVAPQYLPEGSPNRAYEIYKSLAHEPKLIVRFNEFLPKTIMNGILSKFASRSIDKSYFRYGVAFTTDWISGSKEDNINIIECDFTSDTISMYSKSANPYNLREIFENILNIYSGFRAATNDEMYSTRPGISIMDEVCRKKIPIHISIDGINFIDWVELYDRYNKVSPYAASITENSIILPVEGNPQIAGLFKAYYLSKTEVISFATIDTTALQPPKLFISYSHKDEIYKDELLEHLSGMRRSGEIKNWTDRAIVAGEQWDELIKKNIEDADIILFLISSSFVASDYIQNIEIKRAIERHNDNKVIITTVHVRPCDHTSLPLEKVQSASKDLKAISLYTNRDEGWEGVIRNLRATIIKWKSDKGIRPVNVPTS